MRTTMTLALAAALTMAACGDDDAGGSSDTADTTVAESAADDEAAGTDEGTATDGAAATDEDAGTTGTPATNETDGAAATDRTEASATDAQTSGPIVTSADKPEVEIPEEIPEELGRTVLVEGTGDPAEDGDTVIVDYVGVRSSDGVEFDNSYDRGEPFPVVLGAGGVIAGWDQGLVGAQVGERLQLDIPGDLAYGDQARSDVIGENEALTFVIDVHAVIPQSDPADAPTEAGVPASEGATEITTVDLIEGDGPELQVGDTAVMQFVLFRGDNLAGIESTWTTEPVQVPIAVNATLPFLLEGMPGMRVGGRRAITAPPEAVFGPEGNPQMGLPAGTDAIFVIDLLGVY
jgi:FKBP-type peptidyl-prolyl cis-trans isomerase